MEGLTKTSDSKYPAENGRAVWFGSGKMFWVNHMEIEAADRWMEDLFCGELAKETSREDIGAMFQLCWSVWKARNNFVFNKKLPNPDYSADRRGHNNAAHWIATSYQGRNIFSFTGYIPPEFREHFDEGLFLNIRVDSLDGARRRFKRIIREFELVLVCKKLVQDRFGGPIASHIEAVKEGEEPVSFGPNSVLVNYGDGWKLQTVTGAEGLRKGEFNRPTTLHNASVRGLEASQPVISCLYVGKILLALILIFAMGAVLTLALENLPRLILFINSSL
ncbi:hypothetical protein RHMOL_Rhmol03G0054800 [Rhododendron molle]|uniref:Uncharacterized protein n=1 Tax=Rhododendron molle TaxID=49168 RepID=A0ACC0PC31_RHOML|nr:hypothetical protein RHMOL_Rhmol03G0054800 [Rhododendron molle]